MDKERRLIVVAVAAVVIAAAATAFFTPSQTTLPIPEPRQNKGNSSSGIRVLAENLEVPWAIDVAQDNGNNSNDGPLISEDATPMTVQDNSCNDYVAPKKYDQNEIAAKDSSANNTQKNS